MSHRPLAMSYMFSTDYCSESGYYAGDSQVGVPLQTVLQCPPPAWLVADWMIATAAGVPSPPCNAPTTNQGLLWLRDYLR